MRLFHLFSILIVLAAAFSYLNFKILKLPKAIGSMLGSLIFSMLIIGANYFFPNIQEMVSDQLENIDFSALLLEGMLSFMLFAGSIHIKYEDLKSERLTIMLFSTISVLINTFIIGTASYYLLTSFGLQITYIGALLFGSLISPTDPIAVLSILKSAGTPKSLETKIAGESLFNDGVAVVIFMTIFELSNPKVEFGPLEVALLFGQEAFGGLVLGLLIGWLGYKLIASLDSYEIEVFITLAVVMGGYTIAHFLHISGPLGMVVAGLIVGNHGKNFGMSQITAEYVDKFWELVDEILNALLFVLMGLELLIIHTNFITILAGVLLILVGLLSRYLSLWLPSQTIRFKEKITRKTLLILTWGGLRGGISIALALSIPNYLNKELWLTLTYIIVCFSILVQGLTIGRLARKLNLQAS